MTALPTSTNSVSHLREKLTLLSPRKAAAFVTTLSRKERDALEADWPVFAHGHQKPPELARQRRGRGPPGCCSAVAAPARRAPAPNGCRASRSAAAFGRSRAASRSSPRASRSPRGDDRGRPGLLPSIAPGERPPRAARRRLVWPNGAVAQAFSAEDPEALRGPQFDAAWADELAKWRLRGDLGHAAVRTSARGRPRQVVTTTPRPFPLLKRLIADPRPS